MTGSGTDAAAPARSGGERPALTRRAFLAAAISTGAGLLCPFPLPRSGHAAPIPETARVWRAMGTLLEVRVPDLPPGDAVEAIRRVRRRVEELEAAMTLYRPESPLVALNAAPEGRWIDVPSPLAEGLAAALRAAEETGGAFDPTVAPWLRASGLYDLHAPERMRPPRLPAARARRGAIQVDMAGRRARRLDRRVAADLGAIGKGIAVDAALSDLRAAGSASALVNLGGSIGVLGPPPGSPGGWPVGLAHPRRPGGLWCEFVLARGHVATSGDYERFVDTPRGRRHHLLDPDTGESTTGVASVTVWEATGTAADAASTAAFVETARGGRPLGATAWLALAEPDPGALRESRGGPFPRG